MPAMPDMPASAMDKAATQVLDRLGAQHDLPVIPLSDTSWLSRFTLNLPDVMLYGLIALCAATALAVVLRLRRGQAGWDMRVDQAATGLDGAAPHLARAEALAAAHRFMEAMHELLLQALADIRHGSAASQDASLTSREIWRHPALPAAARDPLGDIISQVEWTYFGLRPAGQAAWTECRQRFDLLRAALQQPAPDRAA